MLLKYLNQLDDAVREMNGNPGPESARWCARCVDQLEQYLASQVEPVARRGREIMDATLAGLRVPLADSAAGSTITVGTSPVGTSSVGASSLAKGGLARRQDSRDAQGLPV